MTFWRCLPGLCARTPRMSTVSALPFDWDCPYPASGLSPTVVQVLPCPSPICSCPSPGHPHPCSSPWGTLPLPRVPPHCTGNFVLLYCHTQWIWLKCQQCIPHMSVHAEIVLLRQICAENSFEQTPSGPTPLTLETNQHPLEICIATSPIHKLRFQSRKLKMAHRARTLDRPPNKPSPRAHQPEHCFVTGPAHTLSMQSAHRITLLNLQ